MSNKQLHCNTNDDVLWFIRNFFSRGIFSLLFSCMHSPQTLTILLLVVVIFYQKKLYLSEKIEFLSNFNPVRDANRSGWDREKMKRFFLFNFNRSRNEISTSWFSCCWFDGWNCFQRLFRFFLAGFFVVCWTFFCRILFQFSLRLQLKKICFFLLKKRSVKLNCFWCAWLMRTICSWGAAATRLKPYWAFGSCSSVLFDEYGFGNIR